MPERFSTELSEAVFQAIVYSDVFDFPLTVREVHRYLPWISASYDDVYQALRADSRFISHGNYFHLAGRQNLVSMREQRAGRSKKLLPYALHYGRILGSLPFVRMVALTGSLAVMNISRDVDFDYMLVTQPGRLWTARAFVLLFNRFTKRFGHTICPNLIVSQNCLQWHQQDLYSAHEFCQMIPITGMDSYRKLIKANDWIKDFLPNAYVETNDLPLEKSSRFQKLLEFPLHGRLGNRFEQWEMDRKIARFSKQEGFGEETIFSADMCQGNFDHHRRWTEVQLEQRISKFEVEDLIVSET
jgi:hypothetical protein